MYTHICNINISLCIYIYMYLSAYIHISYMYIHVHIERECLLPSCLKPNPYCPWIAYCLLPIAWRLAPSA